jgi:hypothetical protein
MTMSNRIGRLGRVEAWALLGALGLSGCMLDKQEDADRFREALPKAEQIQVSGPESSQGRSGPSSAPTAEEPWERGPWAKYYGFTRHVRDGVNRVTGAILGGVWLVVHTQPSSVEEREAIWGPWTDSLEPASWRFRVTEVGELEYEYRLEGRPRASQSDADWRAVLTGTGFGKKHASHGDGELTIDLDVARELDPFAIGDDTGKVTIKHDLPREITDNLFALPRVITALVQPSGSEAWFSVTSHAKEDRTGTLLVNAHADADDSGTTALENIQIASQWNARGEGRADITLSGGDVPATMSSVTAVECWDTDFFRVHYSDSVDWAPAEGEPDLCAFSEPLAP